MPAQHKILFLGEPGAGKTTSIATISEIMPICTDVPTTDALSHRKASTTVAMDYGEVTLGDDEKLMLYGVPGQSRFAFMAQVVGDGVVGCLVLVDHGAPDARETLAACLERHRLLLRDRPFVLAINRATGITRAQLEGYVRVVQQVGLMAPVMAIDARLRASVTSALGVLLEMAEFAPLDREEITW